VIGPIPEALYLLVPAMTFTVTPLTSYTYVYIPVSHVYKLACTLHRTINLLPLVYCTPTSDIVTSSTVANRSSVCKKLLTSLLMQFETASISATVARRKTDSVQSSKLTRTKRLPGQAVSSGEFYQCAF
jgi:hypothetical protein